MSDINLRETRVKNSILSLYNVQIIDYYKYIL